LSDRSGAIEVFADVVPLAGAMGGESTHPRPAVKKSLSIHLYLRFRYRHIEAGGRYRGGFAGLLCVPHV